MSYTNPQTKYNALPDVYGGLQEQAINVAANEAARDKKNLNALLTVGEQLATGLIKKKMGMNAFSKESIQRSNRLNKKVASFGTPYDAFNKKSETFFFDLIDQYNQIQTALDQGTHKNPQLARQDMNRIQNLVNQYEEGISDVVATGRIIDEAMSVYSTEGAGAANTLSVTGAFAPQLNIIDKIRRGGALANDIDITHDGGSIILTDITNGSILNMQEFNRAVTDKNNPYIRLVPDLTEELKTGYDIYTKDNKGAYLNEYTKVSGADPNDPMAQRYMTEAQELALTNKLMGSPQTDITNDLPSKYLDGGMFRELIRKQGEYIWEDIMPTKVTGNFEYPDPPAVFGSKEYDEYYNTYYLPMLNYLAKRTIQENASDLRRETVENRLKNISEGKDNLDSKGNVMTKEEMQARKLNKELGRDDYDAKGASRLSQKFITSRNIKEDEALLKNAKVGQIIVLSDGTKVKRTPLQIKDPGTVLEKDNTPFVTK